MGGSGTEGLGDGWVEGRTDWVIGDVFVAVLAGASVCGFFGFFDAGMNWMWCFKGLAVAVVSVGLVCPFLEFMCCV